MVYLHLLDHDATRQLIPLIKPHPPSHKVKNIPYYITNERWQSMMVMAYIENDLGKSTELAELLIKTDVIDRLKVFVYTNLSVIISPSFKKTNCL